MRHLSVTMPGLPRLPSLLTAACVLCRAPAGEHGGLCQPCMGDIQKLRRLSQCQKCAAAVAADGMLCGGCLRAAPHFDATLSFYPYSFPLDMLLRRFKFGGGWQLAGALSALMPQMPEADIILPVPLHPNRERWRGFNQSHELLRAMLKSAAAAAPKSKGVGGNASINNASIKRITDTPHQSRMTGTKARQRNVKGAFVASGVAGKSIIIIDDVMTTGATLNEIAKTLKKAGAKTITNIVVART